MKSITYEHIKVKDVPFTKLIGLEISHTPNSHGIAKIVGFMPYEEALNFSKEADEIFEIEIRAFPDDTSPITLFYGLITKLSTEFENDFAQVTIEAKTVSILLDLVPHSRTFQKTFMCYQNVCNRVMRKYNGKISITANDRMISSLIVQFQETDWQFIQRMASRLNTKVCTDITAKTPYMTVGPFHARKTTDFAIFEYETEKDILAYNTFSKQKKNVLKDDFTEDIITSFFYAHLGDKITWNSKQYYIKRVYASLEDGILVCKYQIGKTPDLLMLPIKNTEIAGKIITGTVKNVKRDKVQVFFHTLDSVYDKKGDWWFPYTTTYSSQDGSGWYSMPAKEDEVHVLFPSADEKDAFAASSVQKTCGAKVTDKIWSGPNGKKILLTEEGIMIIGKEGKLFIGLTDETGIEIISDKNITITSKANVNIQAKDSVNILAEDHILLGTESAHIDIQKEGITMTAENILLP